MNFTFHLVFVLYANISSGNCIFQSGNGQFWSLSFYVLLVKLRSHGYTIYGRRMEGWAQMPGPEQVMPALAPY